MLGVVGTILATGGWLIKGLVYDGHCSHNWFREALMGQFISLTKDDLAGVPFFQDLEWESLPQSSLPRLPVQICKYQGSTIWPLQGVLHSGKCLSNQVVSPLRTIHLGQYWVDSTAARRLGLPPTAYQRSDMMSDKLHILMWNPFFEVLTPDSCLWTCCMWMCVSLSQVFQCAHWLDSWWFFPFQAISSLLFSGHDPSWSGHPGKASGCGLAAAWDAAFESDVGALHCDLSFLKWFI